MVDINGQTGNLKKQSALVLTCIAKYYCALRDGHLPALGVNMGKHFVPLDMGQFKNLGWFSHQTFSPLGGISRKEQSRKTIKVYTTRIPQIGMDKLHVPEVKPDHAVILTNGYFYKVKVFNDGDLVPINEMLGQIEAILEDAKSRGNNENPVSALSLTDRDTWANNRNQLIDLGNGEVLR